MTKKETHVRSMVKAMSWRLLASLMTIMLVLVVFGDPWKALVVGWVELVLKTVGYYGHERIWLMIGWGTER